MARRTSSASSNARSRAKSLLTRRAAEIPRRSSSPRSNSAASVPVLSRPWAYRPALAAGTINKLGTPAQMQALGPRPHDARQDRRVGHHRTGLGLGRVRGHAHRATRDGDEYVLNGQKTWITNGPYADTIVLYAKLDDGSQRRRAPSQGPHLRARPGHARARSSQAHAQDGSARLAHGRGVPQPTCAWVATDCSARAKSPRAAVVRARRTTSSPSAPALPPCHWASLKSAFG
jgi:hypothetical protein